MAFEIPPQPLSDFLALRGDVESDAFTGVTRIVGVPLSTFPTMPAGTFLANVSAATAVPTNHPLATFAGLGLTYTNVTGVLDWDGLSVLDTSVLVGTRRAVNFIPGTNITLTITDNVGSEQVDVLIDSTGGVSDWATVLAIGHTSGANNAHIESGQILSFGVEGSLPPTGTIRSSTDMVLRAGGGFEAISATTMQLQTIGNISFKVATNGVERFEIQGDGAVQFDGQTGTAGQLLKSAGNAAPPVWATFALSDLPTMAAGSFLANVTAGAAVPTAHDLATFAGAGLTYTNVTGIMAVGAGTYITVNANDVAVNRVALSADLDSTSIVDSSGTLQRAALTGAVAAAQNSNATVFAGILNNAAATTDRTNLNFVGFTITDDGVNDRIVITAPLGVTDGDKGDITVSSTGTVWTIDNNAVTLAKFATQAAGSFLANVTAGAAVPTAHDLATFAGAGLTYTNVTGILAVGAGTYITVNANDVAVNRVALSADLDSTSIVDSSGTLQRAALTGAVAAAQNSNATVFSGILNNAVATTDRTNLNFVGFTITDDAGNDRIVITAPLGVTDGDKGDITVSSTGTVWTIDANAVSLSKLATQAAGSFLANVTAGAAVPTAHDLATFAGAGLTYTNVTGIMAVGAGTYITVNANDVAVNRTALSADLDSTSVIDSSGTLQRAALTGAIAAAQNSNATVFAGIRDNGVAETDRTNLNFVSSTSATAVVTDDAGNDELEVTFQRAALTGAIAASANANTTVFSGILNNAVATTDRTNLNFVGFTITDDAVNDRIVITSPASSIEIETQSGGVIGDAINLAFLNGIKTTAVGVDNGGGQMLIRYDLNLNDTYAWTNTHTFTSTTFSVVMSGDIGIGTLDGLGLFAGFTNAGIAAGDLMLNATSGIGIFAGHASAEVAMSEDDISIGAFLGLALTANRAPVTNVATGILLDSGPSSLILSTSSVERLEIESDGAWQVNGSTGTIGQVLTSEGSSASPEWRHVKDRRTCTWWEDFEFIEEVISSATDGSVVRFGNTTWFQAGSSETSTYDFIAAESGHPGILRITTGTAAGTKTGIYRGSLNPATGWVRGDQIQQFEAIVRFTSGSTTTRAFFIGFNEDPQQLDTAGTANSNIIGFLFDSSAAALDTNIQCVTREADGVAVVTDSGVSYSASVQGNWKSFKIVQDTLGTIEFFINDVLVATHSSQVPDSESMNCGLTIATRAGTADVMDIDYVEFIGKPLTRF